MKQIMEIKFSKLGVALTRNQSKHIIGGDGFGSCEETSCKAKSTSSKSCICSTTWDKCLCTSVYAEV